MPLRAEPCNAVGAWEQADMRQAPCTGRLPARFLWTYCYRNCTDIPNPSAWQPGQVMQLSQLQMETKQRDQAYELWLILSIWLEVLHTGSFTASGSICSHVINNMALYQARCLATWLCHSSSSVVPLVPLPDLPLLTPAGPRRSRPSWAYCSRSLTRPLTSSSPTRRSQRSQPRA